MNEGDRWSKARQEPEHVGILQIMRQNDVGCDFFDDPTQFGLSLGPCSGLRRQSCRREARRRDRAGYPSRRHEGAGDAPMKKKRAMALSLQESVQIGYIRLHASNDRAVLCDLKNFHCRLCRDAFSPKASR